MSEEVKKMIIKKIESEDMEISELIMFLTFTAYSVGNLKCTDNTHQA